MTSKREWMQSGGKIPVKLILIQNMAVLECYHQHYTRNIYTMRPLATNEVSTWTFQTHAPPKLEITTSQVTGK